MRQAIHRRNCSILIKQGSSKLPMLRTKFILFAMFWAGCALVVLAATSPKTPHSDHRVESVKLPYLLITWPARFKRKDMLHGG